MNFSKIGRSKSKRCHSIDLAYQSFPSSILAAMIAAFVSPVAFIILAGGSTNVAIIIIRGSTSVGSRILI